MRIVITSGPSYEPLDQVRRLTNFSTGELGTLLAEGFAEAGHTVVCFRGTISTFPAPLWPVEIIPFTTSENLEAGLRDLPAREEVAMVFHAAALGDFRIRDVRNAQGELVQGNKMSSREGLLQLTLEPAPKLIASLRRLFPTSVLVGWKYELDGTPEEVAAKGRRQMEDCLTDACVLNGDAYGPGYGILSRSHEQTHVPTKATLCRFLIEWAERMPVAIGTPGQPSFHALASFMPLAPFI